MSDESSSKNAKSRRSMASITKAAKAASCAAVTFPDGTTVTITHDPGIANSTDGAINDVERWFSEHAN